MPPDPERVRSVFIEVCDVDEGLRTARLTELASGDDELRSAVELLLRHDRSEEQFLDGAWADALDSISSTLRPRPDALQLGDSAQWSQWKIAGFTLVSMIGEGGMGIVYRAEQERPRRSVALKLLRHGFTSPRQTRRFEIEAKALARLRHPGIAQIHEAGTATLAGVVVPYIAMELVEGVPIVEQVRTKRLNTRDTLELFARVCDAVQHAHARGVIHRDLKPTNILVEPSADGIGQPRILDFGVARIIDEDEPGMRTMPGLMVGTIAAMSPEQLREGGPDIDTRCDVYALGVLVYELLAGAPPHDLAGRSMLDAARTVRDEEPMKLGLRHRAYRGDLELIVASAMAKDRERRYASAAALADDVRRYLRVEPIVARPPSGTYAFLRFLERHRVAVGVGAAFAVAIGAVALSAFRAHEREIGANTLAAGRTTALLDFVGTLIKEARLDRRTLATIPLGKSLEVISAKLIETQVAPGEERREAEFHEELGKAFSIHAGMPGVGERHLARAVDLFTIGDPANELRIANTRKIRADALLSLERFDEASEEIEKVISFARRFQKLTYESFAELLTLQSKALSKRPDREQAIDPAREAVAVLVDNRATTQSIAQAHLALADAFRSAERWDEARASLEAAKAVRDADATLASTQIPFAVEKGFLRWARAQSLWDECDRYVERSLSEARAHPGRASVSLVSAELEAGITSHLRGDLAAAERWLLAALDDCNRASEYRPINATRVLRELCEVLEAQPNGSAEKLARYRGELRVAQSSVEGSMTPPPK